MSYLVTFTCYLKQKLKDRFGDDIQFYCPTKRNSLEIVFLGREQLLIVEQIILDGTVAEERPLEMEDSDEGEEMVEEMDIEWAELYMSAQVI